jgi:hypothetical protein
MAIENGQNDVDVITAAGVNTGEWSAYKVLNADVVANITTENGTVITGATLREGDLSPLAMKTFEYVSGTGIVVLYKR